MHIKLFTISVHYTRWLPTVPKTQLPGGGLSDVWHKDESSEGNNTLLGKRGSSLIMTSVDDKGSVRGTDCKLTWSCRKIYLYIYIDMWILFSLEILSIKLDLYNINLWLMMLYHLEFNK